MDEIYTVFIQEAMELLEVLEEGLLRLEAGDHDEETVHSIFRAAHTIKGGAGVVQCTDIEQFTHVLESLLDDLRNHRCTISSALTSALLRASDHLGVMLKRVARGQLQADEQEQALLEQCLAELRSLPAPATADGPGSLSRSERRPHVQLPESVSEGWLVQVRFGRNMLRSGMEPLAFLRHLASLGTVLFMQTLVDELPVAVDFEVESCYLGFAVVLRTDVGKDALEKVFMFCRDECSLSILPPPAHLDDFVAKLQALPEESMRLGEMLVRTGVLTQDELAEGLRGQEGWSAA